MFNLLMLAVWILFSVACGHKNPPQTVPPSITISGETVWRDIDGKGTSQFQNKLDTPIDK